MILSEEKTVIIMTLSIVVPIILLTFIAFTIAVVKRAKKIKGTNTNNQYNDTELLELFGTNNIVNVECDMSRVTVEVKDIDLVNTARLQEKGASGVLLVGNKVKCNFKENSEDIANYLKGNINND